MHLTGEIFGFLTALCWAIGIFPFTIATKYFHANTINLVRLFLAFLFLTLINIIVSKINFFQLFTLPGYQNWIWLGSSGIVGLALGDYFSFKSFKEIGARNSSMFNTLAPGAAILLGFMLLGERINWVGIIGIFITIIGVSLISIFKSNKNEINTFSKLGILYAIGAALCQGAGLVLAKKALQNNAILIAPFHAAWIRISIGFLILFIVLFIKGETKHVPSELKLAKNKKGLNALMLGTFFGSVLGLSFAMKTLELIDSAVAQTIFSLVPVMAIPIAFIYLKEKVSWRILIGAAIALSGVVILIWRNNLI
jgi:drug/metabolite transporter (DMT)-like permease